MKLEICLSPLVIRRSPTGPLTRLMNTGRTLKQQKIAFPKVNDPEILEYNLGDLSDLYKKRWISLPRMMRMLDLSPVLDINQRATFKDFEKYKERIAKDNGC